MDIQLGKNQYLLTKKRVVGTYSNIEHIGEYYLYLGEECSCFNYKSVLYVIGYAIDVDNPSLSIAEMCSELGEKTRNGIYGPEATRSWNGRYIIISKTNNTLVVWHDCCGLKQVFYYFDNNNICLASQAIYIAELELLEKDEEASAYLQQAQQTDKEYCWPVDRTNYAEVRRLLPNHFIDAKDKSVARSYLVFEKPSVRKGAKIISNSLSGAAIIRKLAITVTAGWDSRIVLSACERINEVSAVTLKYNWMSDDNEDIRVARELCRKLDINYQTLACQQPKKQFLEDYMHHSDGGHVYWAQMAEAVKKENYGDYFWVKGSCNEILRNSFGYLHDWQVTTTKLCRLYKLPNTPYSNNAIEEWLNEAKPYCGANKIGILDLFYWEHRMGSWLAECLNEFDCVGETFTPFNSREYIETLYLENRKNRIPPKYKVFKLLIDQNNSSLMEVPINDGRYKTIKAKLGIIIKEYMPIIYGLTLCRK